MESVGAITGYSERAVPAWSPPILAADGITDHAAVARFREAVRAGYTASPVAFHEAEPVTVMGRHFAVISQHRGLIPDSIHTLGKFRWHQAFALVRDIRIAQELDACPVVAASSGYDNYYHWAAETIGTMLIHRIVTGASAPMIIPARTARWQSEIIELLRIDEVFGACGAAADRQHVRQQRLKYENSLSRHCRYSVVACLDHSLLSSPREGEATLKKGDWCGARPHPANRTNCNCANSRTIST